MPKKTMKPYWMAGLLMAGLFAVLLGMRFGLFSGLMNPSLPGAAHLADQVLPEQDTWMSILQNDKKIGYSHSRLFKTADGYAVAETVFFKHHGHGHAPRCQTEHLRRASPGPDRGHVFF